MSLGWLAPTLIGFVGLVLVKIDWRASLTIFVCMAVDFLGLLGAVVPPVVISNQILVHALVGVILGGIVCTGRERVEVRRLPLLASFVLLLLTASWVGSVDDFAAGLWLFAVRSLVFPAAMYAVIVPVQTR